jgi:hypothetical protein
MDSTAIDRLSRALAGPASRRRALRLLGGGGAAGLTTAIGLKGTAAQSGASIAPAGAQDAVKVTGQVGSGGDVSAAARGTFEGTFNFRRFDVKGGELVAIGDLVGKVFDAGGDLVGRVDKVVALPVEVTRTTCRILTLKLGPLDLNLLGLRVQLNRINLRITAEPGPGNLLGNLLCAVAGLLDRPNALADLLNRIFRLLP